MKKNILIVEYEEQFEKDDPNFIRSPNFRLVEILAIHELLYLHQKVHRFD